MNEEQLDENIKEELRSLVDNNLNPNKIKKYLEEKYSLKLSYPQIKKLVEQICNKIYEASEKKWVVASRNIDEDPEKIKTREIISSENTNNPSVEILIAPADDLNTDFSSPETEDLVGNEELESPTDLSMADLITKVDLLSKKVAQLEKQLDKMRRSTEVPDSGKNLGMKPLTMSEFIDLYSGKTKSVSINEPLKDIVVSYVEKKYSGCHNNTSKCIDIALLEALYSGTEGKIKK